MANDETTKLRMLDTASPEGVAERSDADPAGEAVRRPDPEVAAKPSRRTFTAEYKLRVLEEIDRAGPGGQGAILRREGLYTSHLADWRKARRQGALGSLVRKRGRKPAPADASAKRIAKLERDNARLQEQLRKAHLILEVQGKVAGLLGIDLQGGKDS